MVDIASQKYANAKILVSTLLVRADNFDSTRKSLNTKISQLSVVPNLHFINNENITKDLLRDNKHIKKRKIGLLVSNFKNTLFNRINNRRKQIKHPLVDTNSLSYSIIILIEITNPFSHHKTKFISINLQSILITINWFMEIIQPQLNKIMDYPPKSYAQAVVDGHAHTTQSQNGFDPETMMMNLLKIYSLIKQVR